jgi:rhodanese-related sulfurtransferase
LTIRTSARDLPLQGRGVIVAEQFPGQNAQDRNAAYDLVCISQGVCMGNVAFNKFNARRLLPLAVFPVIALIVMYQASTRSYDVANVGVDEARVLIDHGAAVVDVRESDAFNTRHIPGAILIPLEVLRAGVPASFSAAKDQPVVVYCGDGVTSGPEATHLLNTAGYTKAVNLEPGMAGWATAGRPVASGR